jgi:hypothetical protein
LTFGARCGIIIMSRGEARWHWVPHNAKGSTPCTDECENLEKIFEKTFQKPLDKTKQMCYNIDVEGEGFLSPLSLEAWHLALSPHRQ